MRSDDPDFPEHLRMDPPKSVPDNETSLQRTMSMVSLDEPAREKPDTQVMSVSDDDLETVDWAEQMRQESDDRQNPGKGFSLDG